MDNAVALKPMQEVQDATFAGRLKAMPARSKISFAIGVAALAGVIFAMTMWASQGDYKVLYANLSDKDGGAVIAQLCCPISAWRCSTIWSRACCAIRTV